VPVRLVTTPLEGVPRAGVTSVGLVANTRAPEPVSSVTADARLAELGVARKVATPVPRPLTPVLMGRPVALVKVALEGVPRAGVTSVGLVANTKAPEPVSSVTADARLAELGVARKVAMPVPRPDTPVLMGKPVALVRVALEGVPSAGVTSVGLVARTLLPVPVLVTLTTFLLAFNAKAVEAVRPDKVVVPLALSVVNAPAAGVVPPIDMPLSDVDAAKARPVADRTTTWLA